MPLCVKCCFEGCCERVGLSPVSVRGLVVVLGVGPGVTYPKSRCFRV